MVLLTIFFCSIIIIYLRLSIYTLVSFNLNLRVISDFFINGKLTFDNLLYKLGNKNNIIFL